jgi:hypothetical protein
MVVVLNRVTGDTTLSNTAAETTMYTYTVPANMVARSGEMLELLMPTTFTNNSGANRTYMVRIKFGGTTHITDAMIALPTSTADRAGWIQVQIQNDGATNAQVIMATVFVSAAAAGARGDFGAAPTIVASTMIAFSTIDQTAAQVLAVSLQSNAATSTQTITTRSALLTLT